MSRLQLVPDSFEVPQNLKTEHFTIRKLCYDDAVLDYEAVMSSRDLIQRTRGGEWPEATLTFKDDQIDLAWHQREFENRLSFAYTVFDANETECIGCFYLYPPGFRTPLSADAEVDVSFWVTEESYRNGLYAELYKTVTAFLLQWPFQKVYYSNSEIPTV